MMLSNDWPAPDSVAHTVAAKVALPLTEAVAVAESFAVAEAVAVADSLVFGDSADETAAQCCWNCCTVLLKLLDKSL
jgi:hypothetical protein